MIQHVKDVLTVISRVWFMPRHVRRKDLSHIGQSIAKINNCPGCSDDGGIGRSPFHAVSLTPCRTTCKDLFDYGVTNFAQ